MSEPRDLDRAKEHLEPGETVVEWSKGLCESTMLGQEIKRDCIVLATDKRVIVVVPKMFGAFELEAYPFATMTSIEYGKGLLGHSVRFVASGNSMEVTMMSQGNPKALVDYVRSRIGKKDEPKWTCSECASANAAEWTFCGNCGRPKTRTDNVGQGDLLQKLERLADLHASGLLTAEEFKQAKAKLLA